MIYRHVEGRSPVLVNVPHDGALIPAEIAQRMHPENRETPDRDWHIAEVFAFVQSMGCSLLCATHSRYVVDLNRSDADTPLYPGQSETGLCPQVTFADRPIYRDGEAPDAAEIAQRTQQYWRPYHEKLTQCLNQLREKFGHAVLIDAHNIAAVVPKFFSGVLPDLNLGSNDGRSCDARLQGAWENILQTQNRYSFAVNQRFKGGHITRHYGRPELGVHALQLEHSQATHLKSDGRTLDEQKTARLQDCLKKLLEAALEFRP